MGFNAVILAIGAHRSRRLGIPGEDKQGVIDGIDFLREVAADSWASLTGAKGKVPDMAGKRVGVVGGGDVAIDAARVALRCGAREVHVMYRRTGDDMPAAHLPEEIEAALHEGVHIHTLVNPVEVLGNGRVSGVRLQRQRLVEFDNSARRKPAPTDETFTLNLDYLIPAIGQTPDLSWMKGLDLEISGSKTLVVNESYCTSRPGVFAAGDAVSGPATIVQAVAQGNLVAASVHHWLKTGELARPRFITPRHDIPLTYNMDEMASARRPATPRLSVAEREGNWREVEVGLSEEAARAEARRCLRCDLEWLDVVGIERPVPIR